MPPGGRPADQSRQRSRQTPATPGFFARCGHRANTGSPHRGWAAGGPPRPAGLCATGPLRGAGRHHPSAAPMPRPWRTRARQSGAQTPAVDRCGSPASGARRGGRRGRARIPAGLGAHPAESSAQCHRPAAAPGPCPRFATARSRGPRCCCRCRRRWCGGCCGAGMPASPQIAALVCKPRAAPWWRQSARRCFREKGPAPMPRHQSGAHRACCAWRRSATPPPPAAWRR